MECDLSWMVGRSIAEVVIRNPTSWTFAFGKDAEIRTECPWRLIADGRIVLSGEDHGHKYGLPAPIAADRACLARIGGAVIVAAEVRDGTRDMVLGFASGDRLEILPLSSGYESWHLVGPDGSFTVAIGGGDLAIWGPRD